MVVFVKLNGYHNRLLKKSGYVPLVFNRTLFSWINCFFSY
jgi:hypothetical protein